MAVSGSVRTFWAIGLPITVGMSLGLIGTDALRWGLNSLPLMYCLRGTLGIYERQQLQGPESKLVRDFMS
jgi:hypothetical protein